MIIKKRDDVPALAVSDKLPGVTKQALIGPDDGAGNFAMRRFILAPGASTPHHAHDWEHEVYIVEGEGIVADEQGEHPLRPTDVVLVPADEIHHFTNVGTGNFSFLCMVPMKGADLACKSR